MYTIVLLVLPDLPPQYSQWTGQLSSYISLTLHSPTPSLQIYHYMYTGLTPAVSTVDRTVNNGEAFIGALTGPLGVLATVCCGVVLAS